MTIKIVGTHSDSSVAMGDFWEGREDDCSICFLDSYLLPLFIKLYMYIYLYVFVLYFTTDKGPKIKGEKNPRKALNIEDSVNKYRVA